MKLRLPTLALLLLAVISSQSAQAAFCALRDPVVTIQKLFPDSTSHRSVIKVVGEDQRRAVSALMPPNTLHFSELGQHTLYITFKDQTPLGYLHVRSEESEWGLVEVAWALTPDLKVIDFHLQRCRSRAKREITAPAFRNQLKGLSYLEMKQLLAADGSSLKPGALKVSATATPLAEVIVKCGLKTIVVTELAWADEVELYAGLARAQHSFTSATELKQIEDTVLSQKFDSVANHFPGQVTAMNLEGSELYAITSSSGNTVGAVFRHPLTEANPGKPVEWHIDPEGKVIAIHNPQGWPDNATANALKSHVNQSFDGQTSCADRPQLLTKQAALMARLAFPE